MQKEALLKTVCRVQNLCATSGVFACKRACCFPCESSGISSISCTARARGLANCHVIHLVPIGHGPQSLTWIIANSLINGSSPQTAWFMWPQARSWSWHQLGSVHWESNEWLVASLAATAHLVRWQAMALCFLTKRSKEPEAHTNGAQALNKDNHACDLPRQVLGVDGMRGTICWMNALVTIRQIVRFTRNCTLNLQCWLCPVRGIIQG